MFATQCPLSDYLKCEIENKTNFRMPSPNPQLIKTFIFASH